MTPKLIEKLTDFGKVLRDEPLAGYTTYGVGGNCKAMIIPNRESEVVSALRFLSKNKIPFFVIGKGSNLLVSDSGYPGIVIKLGEKFENIQLQGTIVQAGAAANLWDLVRKTSEAGLCGLENLAGIPGSVGGALYMNAGAYGATISDSIMRIRIIKGPEYNAEWLDQGGISFNYRESIKDAIFLWADFLLEFSNEEECKSKISRIINKRKNAQPVTKPSCGCVFKNPISSHAGMIIDKLGLKGLNVRGAEVSPKHANFIVSQKGTRAQDIWELAQIVKYTVKKHRGIDLEFEVQLKGEFDGVVYY